MLTQKLNKDLSGQSGACFRSTYFQPTFSKYNDTVVPGVQWLADRSMASVHDPFLVATVVLQSFQKLANPKTAFVWDGSWFGHPGTQLIGHTFSHYDVSTCVCNIVLCLQMHMRAPLSIAGHLRGVILLKTLWITSTKRHRYSRWRHENHFYSISN